MEKPFWIVWNPLHPSTPKVKFWRRKDAQHAARKMAEEHFGDYFFVMKAQSCHQMQSRMEDFIIVPFGVGAPCPYHG